MSSAGFIGTQAPPSAQVAAREARGGRAVSGRFPARKSLEDFDFEHARGLKRETIAHVGTLHFIAARDDVEAARELVREDPSFAQELPALEATLAAAEDRLRRLLVPRDPDDDRAVILEVKAGEGGE